MDPLQSLRRNRSLARRRALTFLTTGVLAVFALEGFFSSVSAHVLDQRALGRGRVDADVAAERLLARVCAQVGSQWTFLSGSVFAKVAWIKRCRRIKQ